MKKKSMLSHKMSKLAPKTIFEHQKAQKLAPIVIFGLNRGALLLCNNFGVRPRQWFGQIGIFYQKKLFSSKIG